MESRTTAKDFFLHLGSMVGLYASAISFITLIFRVIDKAYPEITSYYYSSPNISFPVATLIIFFPIFILLSWLNEKSYRNDPSKKQIGIRRWLTYITLFVAGIILAGDLVYILYKFLDGQSLTTAFILKALAVLLLTGYIFWFYIYDIRNKLTPQNKKMWAIATAVVAIGSITVGFTVIGSPQTQRLMRYDDQKVQDLQNIQYNVTNYYQKKGYLPSKLDDLRDPISGVVINADPQSGAQYEYKQTGATSFELCAEFNTENANSYGSPARLATPSPVTYPASKGSGEMDYWAHKPGHVCFDRTIDTKLYPVYKQ